MKYEIEYGRDKYVEVPESMQDKIVRDYLIRRYHWVIGISAVEAVDLKFTKREFESHFGYCIIK